MSTTYVLNKQISFKALLDGRLEKHGVYEDTNRFGSPEKINIGIDACNIKVLTDGLNYIGVYGDEYVQAIQRCGTNVAEYILDAISTVFDTDYLSEHQPEFWGFESLAEQDLAEIMGAERERTIAYEKIMKFVRGESHDFEQDSQELHDAVIAKELIAGNPDWADPNHRTELFEAILKYREKHNPFVPEGPDGDLLRTIFMRDEQEQRDYEDFEKAFDKLVDEGLLENNATERSVEQFPEIKVREIIEHTGCEPMIAEVAIQFALDEHALTDQFTLRFKNHGLVAVSEVLSNPVKFDQQCLVDPLALSYVDYSATFQWSNGSPLVSSNSHNGRIYRFHKNQINKAILLHGISIAHTEEGKKYAPRALRAACDLLIDGCGFA